MLTHAYHILKDDFVGNTIYPLSKLKEIHSEVAEKAAQKYIGREHQMNKIVYDLAYHKNLDWGDQVLLWNDVAFYTIHNPTVVFKTFKDLGIPIKQQWRITKIPISNFSKRSVIWKSTKDFKDHMPLDDIISIQDAGEAFDLSRVPDAAIEYYKQYFTIEGFRVLLYPYVPHLLTADEVKLKIAIYSM
jgi:hypothetical protein